MYSQRPSARPCGPPGCDRRPSRAFRPWSASRPVLTQKRSAGHAHALSPVQHLLTPGAFVSHDLRIGVDQQREIEIVLGNELLMRLRAVDPAIRSANLRSTQSGFRQRPPPTQLMTASILTSSLAGVRNCGQLVQGDCPTAPRAHAARGQASPHSPPLSPSDSTHNRSANVNSKVLDLSSLVGLT